jgi:hypothetical protein
LLKTVHQTPWLALVWARLSKHLVKLNDPKMNTMTSSTLVINKQKSHTADSLSEAYQYAAISTKDKKFAQRAVLTAPWRLSAWKTL